jgi:maleylpyruvate isomerase
VHQLSEDPAPDVVPSLLDALDDATGALSTSLGRLTADALNRPSLLDGWSRAHVVAHLANVADALVRMTADALSGTATRMYPGGRAQRNADIDKTAHTNQRQLLDAFRSSANRLSSTWHEVATDSWATAVDEQDLGTMQLSRLVALRLTEVEVHHADLAVGFGPREWSPDFTHTCLPLRVAALARMRRRPDADHAIRGTWLLLCDDLGRQWRVLADGARVDITEITDTTEGERLADTVLRGTANDLVAFLLGRQDPAMLGVEGDAGRARTFKRAFPGP